MANRSSKFGAEVSEIDKKKVTKDSFGKALKIFRYSLPYKWTFAIGFLFLILSQVTSMSVPLLMGQMVGAIVAPGKATDNNLMGMGGGVFQKLFSRTENFTLNEITAIFVVTLLLQAIFSFFRVYTFTQVSEKSMRDLRKDLYTKIITLPISFFEKSRVGELMSRITSDVGQLQDVLSITLAEMFRQVFTLVGGVILIFVISGKLTLFMLATFPFLVVAAIVFGKFIRKNSKKVQDELAKTNIIVEETLQSINAVKAFTNERLEINRYDSSIQKVVNYALKAATFRGGFISFIILVLFGGVVGVVWYGGNLVISGELAFKDLFTFILYTGFIGGSVGGLGDMYAQIQRTLGASERVLEIIGEESEINVSAATLTPHHVKGNIKFQNIGFAYPSRKDIDVLKDISFSINSGEKIALVGQSGAGKSTIVQLLMHLYSPDRGKILIDEQDIAFQDISHLRSNIAIVPQEVMLFGGTIYENIAYGKPNATSLEILEAAKQANAFEFIESFPDKFQTIVGERGVKLSGGQKQRIAIARAILKNPSILILDEATSALDSESEKLVQEALDELMKNRTTIIIAHRLATIRFVDNIYVLKDGKIVESGNHQDLIQKTEGIYANLVNLQFNHVNLSNE